MATLTEAAKKTAKNSNGAKTPKPTVSEEMKVSGKGKLKPVNIEDRIKRINRLMDLGRQRESLLARKSQIEEFYFGSDKLKDRLSIIDSRGKTFETSNSNLIEMISEHLKMLVTEKIEQVEQLIIEAEL